METQDPTGIENGPKTPHVAVNTDPSGGISEPDSAPESTDERAPENPRESVDNPSPAYRAFVRGDYAHAVELIDPTRSDGEDPIDLERALALDPAIPMTGLVLAIIWVSIALQVV